MTVRHRCKRSAVLKVNLQALTSRWDQRSSQQLFTTEMMASEEETGGCEMGRDLTSAEEIQMDQESFQLIFCALRLLDITN